MKTGAETLLSIDYSAAIDKLAGSQLQGSWQLPAELARLAIASGARAVELDVEPRHLSMKAPGARWHQSTISDFASLLDRRLEVEDRHRAMVDLEERGAFVLSAIACSRPRRVVLTLGDDHGLKLERAASGDLAVSNPSASGRPDVRLTIEGLAIEVERATGWLRRVGRFSPVPISIDGTPIPHGFRAPLIENRLDVRAPEPRSAHPPAGVAPAGVAQAGVAPAGVAPAGVTPAGVTLPTTLAIPRHGSTPRLWLLRHGIIATHATVPGFPAFEAAIEMAALHGQDQTPDPGFGSSPRAPRVTGAALRERLGPYLESLVDAAAGLTIELGKTAGSLPEEVRGRVARLLLRSALKRRRLSEVSGVRIFPLLGSRDRSLVSIDIVSRLVRVEEGGACALDAVPPEHDPKRYTVAGRGALAISQGERALLGELLSVVFSQPPARARQSLRRRLLGLAAERLRALRPASGVAIAGSELSAIERGLLRGLAGDQTDGAAVEAELRTGSGKVRHAGDGKLLLPRHNATVRACGRAVERDDAWLYPAAIALAGGRELHGTELRRRWYAKLDLGDWCESQSRARARDVSSDQGAEPQ